MPDFVFDKPVTGPGESDAVSVQLEQAVTYDGVYVTVGLKQLLSGLIDNPEDPNQYLISEPLADDSQYTRLRYYAAGNVAGDPTVPLPPVSADPEEGVLIVDMRFWEEAGQQPAAGISVTICPVAPTGDGSFVLQNQSWNGITDATGYLSISIPVGISINIEVPAAGIYQLNVPITTAVMYLADLI